jgi:hypothetical protein
MRKYLLKAAFAAKQSLTQLITKTILVPLYTMVRICNKLTFLNIENEFIFSKSLYYNIEKTSQLREAGETDEKQIHTPFWNQT